VRFSPCEPVSPPTAKEMPTFWTVTEKEDGCVYVYYKGKGAGEFWASSGSYRVRIYSMAAALDSYARSKSAAITQIKKHVRDSRRKGDPYCLWL
jgi:hypothetical protein